MGVYEQIENGRAAMLDAIIRKLAMNFDECESNRDLKAISVELREASRELDEIKAPEASTNEPKTGIDELRARREQKLRERGVG